MPDETDPRTRGRRLRARADRDMDAAVRHRRAADAHPDPAVAGRMASEASEMAEQAWLTLCEGIRLDPAPRD